jgi:hypothetical protein
MAIQSEEERFRRWRLVLGSESQSLRGGAATSDGLPVNLVGDDAQMDKVLEALYDSDRSAGLGSSCPSVNRWLGDIRTYFPKSVVQVMQKDAMERLHLQQMLLEPETLGWSTSRTNCTTRSTSCSARSSAAGPTSTGR